MSMPLFEDEFHRLNDRQKEAVETIEGPVMVVAGPGTGKTQVVAMRVAAILKRTQMRPGNILCLTYSVSGATAMRERLRELIGPDAYGIGIRNFHGFCNDLIQEHPLVFDDWSALEPISDIERYREVNKIIDQLLPHIDLINRKDPYRRTRDILSRISDLKREGKTGRADLLSIADAYENGMAGKSREGTKAHEKNLLAARKFRDFLEIFFRYQEMLARTQRYDYDDMILTVNAALTEHDWLLSSLQERYQYVLIDEFQDTNGAQYRLLELLTTYPTLDHEPNICVVGDDDQAIYRFQGANLGNILAFRKRFPSAPVIPLTVSYRCSQPILDAAGALISRNTERLVGKVEGLTKDLVAGGATATDPPTLLRTPSDRTEPWAIADLIDALLRDGIAPHEIAVLTQKNADLLEIYPVLAARGIPVELTGKVDLLQQPLVGQLLCILRAGANPMDSAALAAALSGPCFGCHPADLGRLYLLRTKEQRPLNGTLFDIDVPGTAASALPFVALERLVNARNVMNQLFLDLPGRTVIHTMEAAMKNTGLLTLAAGEPSGKGFDPLAFAALQEFFDYCKKRAYEQPQFSLYILLNDLEYYGNPDYGELRLSCDIPHLTEDGVQLMTAHKSKGLEFDAVILHDFREGHWDKKRSPGSVSVPEDLLFGWVKDTKTFEKEQDERRVAYVAMTRARSRLYFTCPRQVINGDRAREVSPSGFFAEAGTLPEEDRELLHPEHAATLLLPPPAPVDDAFAVFLRDRLKEYALSVTALNHFLEDPQTFLMFDLLQTPQAKVASLVYGNAVHEALKAYGLALQRGESFGEKEFMGAFRTFLREREVLTDAERERFIKDGEDTLPRYFAERSARSPLVHSVEKPIFTHCGDVPIKGKLDRIELLLPQSSDCVVLHFNTGKPKTEKEIREGGYFRQLVFYALLIEESGLPLSPKEFVLDFVGDREEHPVERRFTVTEKDKQDLRSVITRVWSKVTALDFTPLEEV